jgi:hypothetical protein
MPSANINVLKALFESYLNIRIPQWGASPPAAKIATVKACLEEIENLNDKLDENSLRNLVYKFSERARAELAEANHTRSGVLYFFGVSRLFIDRPMLLETIASAISYIAANENSVNLSEYEFVLSGLKSLSSYPKDMKDLHLVYFDQVIKHSDTQAVKLKEKSFDAYAKNVNDGCRKFPEADKLLGLDKSKKEKNTMSSTAVITTSIDSPPSSLGTDRPATPDVSIAISSRSKPHFTFTTAAKMEAAKPPRVTSYGAYGQPPRIYMTRSEKKKAAILRRQQEAEVAARAERSPMIR